MVSGKGLKRPFLTVYLPKKEQTERQFVDVPQTLPMALGMHGKNTMKHTTETLKNL